MSRQHKRHSSGRQTSRQLKCKQHARDDIQMGGLAFPKCLAMTISYNAVAVVTATSQLKTATEIREASPPKHTEDGHTHTHTHTHANANTPKRWNTACRRKSYNLKATCSSPLRPHVLHNTELQWRVGGGHTVHSRSGLDMLVMIWKMMIVVDRDFKINQYGENQNKDKLIIKRVISWHRPWW